jgi:hypothetical protein
VRVQLPAAAMIAEVGRVLGTLAYPHLILPYSGYYGHLASHYGVLGAPLYPVGEITRTYGVHVPVLPVYKNL